MTFAPEIVARATNHMNEDHSDGNLYIVKAFADATATSAVMTTLDYESGTWEYVSGDGETKRATVKWPVGQITERMQIRVEVVKLYKDACTKLGVETREH